MLIIANALNWRWNALVYWCHDAATRTDIRWLVALSIWAYDRLTWRLPDEWQLIGGIPFREYTLQCELELARHQVQYFADYAYELQWRLIDSARQEGSEPEEPPSRPRRRNPARTVARAR